MTKKRTIFKQHARRLNRQGSLMTEALVAAAILLVGVTIIGKASANFRRLWSDSRHFQLAADELSNQMQRITVLSRQDAADRLKGLVVSPEIAAILPEPKLTGLLISDEAGDRVRLTIDWKRVGSGEPLELVGWIQTNAASSRTSANPQLGNSTNTDKNQPLDVTSVSESQK